MGSTFSSVPPNNNKKRSSLLPNRQGGCARRRRSATTRNVLRLHANSASHRPPSPTMNVISTSLEGVVILEPRVFEDARGYFFESFSQREFDEKVRPIRFVQDNESRSTRGVMRGLHYQRMPHTQSKLVRCTQGSVVDVAVDIRHGSPTFGQHVAVELSAENHRQLFIPRGFAHGFAVLSDIAVFEYKCDNFYAPESDAGISLLDERLDIDWRMPVADALLSEKDLHHPLFDEAPADFHIDDRLY